MSRPVPPLRSKLNLRVGDFVEVRSENEILSTLDASGRFDSLPFMPEMLQYCGRRFQVFKRADKLCDTIVRDGLRRMYDTVLLGDLRCDGAAHGGCQAACTLLWKEAWLKRVSDLSTVTIQSSNDAPHESSQPSACGKEHLLNSSRKPGPPSDPAGEYFSCQATELRGATSYLAFWDPRQYWRDIYSGNVGILLLLRAFAIWVFNKVQTYRRGAKYPFIQGQLKKTPTLRLDLQPGELVQLRPKNEILQTLDVNERNRGLSFDRELVKYCGETYRVRQRVDQLVDEKTGKFMRLSNPSIILDGVICTGDYNRYCPRATYHFVREIWLRRVEVPAEASAPISSSAAANSPCSRDCAVEENAFRARPVRVSQDSAAVQS